MSTPRVVQYGEFLNAFALGAVGLWMLIIDVSAGYGRILGRPSVVGGILIICCALQLAVSAQRQFLAARTMLFISALLWCYLAAATLLWRPFALDTPAISALAWNAAACYIRSWRFRSNPT